MTGGHPFYFPQVLVPVQSLDLYAHFPPVFAFTGPCFGPVCTGGREYPPGGLRFALRAPLRPLPLSGSSLLRNNGQPAGPSPYPCPGVDTPPGGYSLPWCRSPSSWRRYPLFGAGTPPLGAGPIFHWGPAPQNGHLCVPVAQVGHRKLDLRHPAPRHPALRQEGGAPTPYLPTPSPKRLPAARLLAETGFYR